MVCPPFLLGRPPGRCPPLSHRSARKSRPFRDLLTQIRGWCYGGPARPGTRKPTCQKPSASISTAIPTSATASSPRTTWPSAWPQAGVRAAALTDHDTIEGLPAFREALARKGVGFITGVELTVDRSRGRGEAHPRLRLRPREQGPAGPPGRGPRANKRPSYLQALSSAFDRGRAASDRPDAAGGRTGPGMPAAAKPSASLHEAGGLAVLAHPVIPGQPPDLPGPRAARRPAQEPGASTASRPSIPATRRASAATSSPWPSGTGCVVERRQRLPRPGPARGRPTSPRRCPGRLWQAFRDAVLRRRAGPSSGPPVPRLPDRRAPCRGRAGTPSSSGSSCRRPWPSACSSSSCSGSSSRRSRTACSNASGTRSGS